MPAEFVADPFLLAHGGLWYMFFEVMREDIRRGEIGLATSLDGTSWQYQGIVLREWCHLSYPYVFEWQRDFYMVPETLAARSVRLYRARSFPTGWTHEADLLPGMHADATLVRHDNRWWMFTCPYPCDQDMLRLYRTTRLTGLWQEHPKSPIVERDATKARPGGRMVVWQGRLLRFAQDCMPHYGTRVRAFRVTSLTEDDYQEREADESPILGPGTDEWNRSGMHHIDPAEAAHRRWIACVDGCFHEEVTLAPPDPMSVRTLNYWKESWPLVADRCPCDIHFQEYLNERRIGGRTIFHFGTGEHHLLGRENFRADPPNEILGITASRQEYDAYIDFVIGHPLAARHYKVLFADIYTLSPQILPGFDLVTLFHLGEFYDAHASAYAQLDDVSLLDLFVSKLNRGGKIFLYRDSGRGASERAREIVGACCAAGMLVPIEDYKSLTVYSLPD